jgi:hypothetical protein
MVGIFTLQPQHRSPPVGHRVFSRDSSLPDLTRGAPPVRDPEDAMATMSRTLMGSVALFGAVALSTLANAQTDRRLLKDELLFQRAT